MNFRGCRLFLLIAMVSLVAPRGFASNIRMLNGSVYENVTVLRRDADAITVLTQFGTVKFPLATVDTIDGVSVHGTPSAPPPAALAQPPGATNVPSIIPGVDQVLKPAQAPGISPRPSFTQESEPSPTPDEWTTPVPQWPPYEHRYNMDIVLAALVAISAIWIGSVASVKRSLYKRRVDPRFWSNASIVLPGVGFLAYQVARQIAVSKERRAAKQSPNEVIAGREKELGRHRKGFKFLDEERKSIIIKDKGETSGLEHAHEVLEEAMMERASDVHIDPGEEEYLVRFRIDGVMQPRMRFAREEGARVVSALKTLAEIDVAEKRKAQDGRFKVRTDEGDVDFRVATANSIFGEKLVIRILNRKSGLLGLADLGMPAAMMDQFARVIHSRNGMIIATGPTGSGKTSTLYSALSQLDSGRLNIMTIEDPVEYGLAGATQIPVNVKAGITYESGLRSILRQDPDVIFVGEMRDAEAAQVALRAALTGHLVFSSLHTRDAVGTIVRLEEMGMDRHLLASSLLLLIAQRLLRVLCPVCREAYACGAEDLGEIGIELPPGETIYRAKGCKECDNTGYLGRTGIFEMIVFDDEVRQAVNAGEGEAALQELAKAKGFASFRVNGAEKVLLGITSVEEVLQAS